MHLYRRYSFLISFVLFVAFCLVLASCAPTSGTVTDKRHSDKGYELHIHSKAGGDGWQIVPAVTYNKCEVGDSWPDCDKKETS